MGNALGRRAFVLNDAVIWPEKNQSAQLRALASLFRSRPDFKTNPSSRVRLVLLGGCRDDKDNSRVQELKALAQELGLSVSPRYLPEHLHCSPDTS